VAENQASESDERTFDGIVLRDALTGVRDRGNEAGRDVDLSRAATAVVERKVSFPFHVARGGGMVLMSSSPLSVAESTVAWPRAQAVVLDYVVRLW
jgi:hypothetical protein